MMIRNGVTAMLLCSALVLSQNAQAASASKSRCGGASWYALHSKTASGERMDPAKLTAAHKSLRFGTKVKVTNMRNGKSVVVRINDRGPFVRGRVIDLSKAAASRLSMVRAGIGKVCFEVLG